MLHIREKLLPKIGGIVLQDITEEKDNLLVQFCSSDCGIGFDPSYISKSGKQTPGI
jgi:hypothetical protein